MNSSTTWSYKTDGRFYGTQADWNETIISKINELSAQIHKKYLQGGANLIYCSSNLRDIIENLSYYNDGSLGGRYGVRFTKSNENVIEIVANVGQTQRILVTDYSVAIDAGDGRLHVTCTPNSGIDAEAELTTMLSEQLAGEIDSEFKSKHGIMTRYGNKPVNEEFYGKIRIGGIQNNRRRLLLIGL